MSATAVVGIGVPFGLLFRTEEKGCGHEVPVDQPFCGKCGKPRVTVKRVFIGGDEGYQFEKHYIYRPERPRDETIVVISAAVDYDSPMKVNTDTDLSESPIRPEAVEQGREILRALFAKHSLPWDETKFGIWANCSY